MVEVLLLGNKGQKQGGVGAMGSCGAISAWVRLRETTRDYLSRAGCPRLRPGGLEDPREGEHTTSML